jgi:hypothetical protein
MNMSDSKNEVLKKHRKIFRHYFEKSDKSASLPISFGLEISDGWLPIIDDLCTLIQNHVDWKQKDNPKFPQVEAQQCKEKFGGLRFYVSGSDEFVRGLIAMAEANSFRTCEMCGKPAQMRRTGWMRVTCDSCEEKRNQKFPISQSEEGEESP